MKKILSLCMICMMLLTLAPLAAFADYADGQNCGSCGHYHWDSYCCGSCGRCTEDCRSDCYEYSHCHSCGECFSEMRENEYCTECWNCIDCGENEHCKYCGECGREICDGCNVCEDCLSTNGAICPHCSACLRCLYSGEGFEEDEMCKTCRGTLACCLETVCQECHSSCDKCKSEEDFCAVCKVCIDCVTDGVLCQVCGTCKDCWSGDHCTECNNCAYEYHDTCEMCEECAEKDDRICEKCGSCGFCKDWEPSDICPNCHACPEEYDRRCEDGEHCNLCWEWICENCNQCSYEGNTLCEGCGDYCSSCEIFCDDCEKCEECCRNTSEENGCYHDICVESSDWNDPSHRCQSCENCFEEDEMCDACSLCAECCFNESQRNGCDHGICVESADWDADDHRCSRCGDCFEENEFCPECSYCLDCCLNNADLAGCVHGICIESNEWRTHFCGQHGGCVEVLCDICGGCAGCCDKTRVQQNCTHTHVCPGSSGWSKHFCKTCNKCFAPNELCQYCGKCLTCCKAATPCSCGNDICPSDPKWIDHYCTSHGTCFSKCAHGAHTHTPGSTYVQEDTNRHYQTCTICGMAMNRNRHRFGEWVRESFSVSPIEGNIAIVHSNCLDCGYFWRKTSSVSSACVNGTCEGSEVLAYDTTHHWRQCSRCGDIKTNTKTTHDFSTNPYACGALNCYYKKIAAPGIDTVGGQDLEWDYLTYVNGKEKYYAADEFTAIFGEKLIIPYTLLCGENVKMSIIDPETGMKIIPQQMVSYTKDSVVMDFQTPQFQTQFENQYGKCGRYEFILRAHNELGNYEAYYNSDVRFFINLPHETDEWQMNETQHWKICSNSKCPDGGMRVNIGAHDWRHGDACVSCGRIRPVRITWQTADPKPTYRHGRDDENFVKLSVKARGSNLTYQWYKASYDANGDVKLYKALDITEDPVNGHAGTKTDTLTVGLYDAMCGEVLRYEDEFMFACVVTGDGGTVQSKPICITPQHDTSSYEYRNSVAYTGSRTDRHMVLCKNCHEEFYLQSHTPGYWKTTKEPTVDAEGEQTYFCADCGLTRQKQSIPKLAAPHTHNFTVVAHDSIAHWNTCSDETCGRSDNSYVRHTYSDWGTVTAPTTSAPGLKKRICSQAGCWNEQTAPIAALTHKCSFVNSSYVHDETSHWLECESPDCSEKLRVIPHHYRQMVFPKKPTLTEEGIGHHVCDVCLYEEEVTIPKLEAAPALRLTNQNGEHRIYATNGGQSAWLWIGSYRKGRMIDLKKTPIRKIDFPVVDMPLSSTELNTAGADEIRAFMFSYNGMIRPLLPMTSLVLLPDSVEEKALRLYNENGIYRVYASGGGQSATVYVGSYRKGRMIDVKQQILDKTNPVLNSSVADLQLNITGADEIRAFIFSDPQKLLPALPSESLTIPVH